MTTELSWPMVVVLMGVFFLIGFAISSVTRSSPPSNDDPLPPQEPMWKETTTTTTRVDKDELMKVLREMGHPEEPKVSDKEISAMVERIVARDYSTMLKKVEEKIENMRNDRTP